MNLIWVEVSDIFKSMTDNVLVSRQLDHVINSAQLLAFVKTSCCKSKGHSHPGKDGGDCCSHWGRTRNYQKITETLKKHTLCITERSRRDLSHMGNGESRASLLELTDMSSQGLHESRVVVVWESELLASGLNNGLESRVVDVTNSGEKMVLHLEGKSTRDEMPDLGVSGEVGSGSDLHLSPVTRNNTDVLGGREFNVINNMSDLEHKGKPVASVEKMDVPEKEDTKRIDAKVHGKGSNVEEVEALSTPEEKGLSPVGRIEVNVSDFATQEHLEVIDKDRLGAEETVHEHGVDVLVSMP